MAGCQGGEDYDYAGLNGRKLLEEPTEVRLDGEPSLLTEF